MVYANKSTWDLDGLIAPLGSIEEGLTTVAIEIERLRAYEGNISTQNLDNIFAMMSAYSQTVEHLKRIRSYKKIVDENYSRNDGEPDSKNPENETEFKSSTQILAELESRLAFIDVELNDLPDENFQAILDDPRFSFCKHYLEKLQQRKIYLLTPKREKAIAEARGVEVDEPTNDFYDILDSMVIIPADGETNEVGLWTALKMLESPDPSVRKLVGEKKSEALAQNVEALKETFLRIVEAKHRIDTERGCPSWLTMRNLDNDISDESLAALVDASTANVEIAQQWFKLKAEILGLDKLSVYDRKAPLVEIEMTFTYAQSCEIARATFAAISPEIAELFDIAMAENWIESSPTDGQAECHYTVPSYHPLVMLNFDENRNGTLDDLMALVHEMGHGIHARLSSKQGVLHHEAAMTVMETASVHLEGLVLDNLIANSTGAEKLYLQGKKIDEQVDCAFRQLSMHLFEDAAYKLYAEQGTLSVDNLNGLWIDSQRAFYGDSVDFPPGFETWWCYIPQIYEPGYLYSYAFGQATAIGISAQFKIIGPGLATAYIDLLAAGGSLTPVGLMQKVGVDINDPTFYLNTMGVILANIQDEKNIAAELGLVDSGYHVDDSHGVSSNANGPAPVAVDRAVKFPHR